MAGSESGTQVKTIDLTPNLPNSPLVDQLIRFVQRVYWYDDAGEANQPMHTYLDANRSAVIDAMRELKTDDSLILITGKLPSDRDRFIGTQRKVPTGNYQRRPNN